MLCIALTLSPWTGEDIDSTYVMQAKLNAMQWYYCVPDEYVCHQALKASLRLKKDKLYNKLPLWCLQLTESQKALPQREKPLYSWADCSPCYTRISDCSCCLSSLDQTALPVANCFELWLIFNPSNLISFMPRPSTINPLVPERSPSSWHKNFWSLIQYFMCNHAQSICERLWSKN